MIDRGRLESPVIVLTARQDAEGGAMHVEEDDGATRRLLAAERQAATAELLRAAGSVTVAEVQERFGVSPMTARRDLRILEESGLARRTHGGAMLPGGRNHPSAGDAFADAAREHAAERARIAEAVAATVRADESVYLDSSPAAIEVARRLVRGQLPLTIVTNSQPIAHLVAEAEPGNVRLTAIGGALNRRTRGFVGPSAMETIRRHFADRLFLSVRGVAPSGALTESDELEAEVKRAMIERSRSVLLVAQGHKFDERGLNVVVPFSRVDQSYLTDAPIAGSRVLQEAGVDVISV